MTIDKIVFRNYQLLENVAIPLNQDGALNRWQGKE